MPIPQILIIPGSYTSALSYYDIRDSIRRSHSDWPEALVYDLPSASSGPPLSPPTLYDDGAFFAEKITDLADQGINVVLLAHSYGGLVAREALRGISKAERASQGKKGGIIKVVYLSAVIAEPGKSSGDVLSGADFDFFDPFDKDYVRQLYHKSAQRVFSDLPLREGIRHATRTTAHSIVCFSNPTSERSDFDKSIPSTYIYCTKDQILPLDFQRERVEVLKHESGPDKVQTIEIETGHCPNASAPELVVRVVSDVVLAL